MNCHGCCRLMRNSWTEMLHRGSECGGSNGNIAKSHFYRPDGRSPDRLALVLGLVTEQEGRLLEVGGMPDHVHLLAEIPRTVAVADFLQTIKSTSNLRLGQDDGPFSAFGWQRGYGAFSVSRSQTSVVAQYIRRQEEHHQGMSFDDELRRLLAEHGLGFQKVGWQAPDQR